MLAVGRPAVGHANHCIQVIVKNGEVLFFRTHDCLECWLCACTGRPPVAPTDGILCETRQ